MHRMATRLPAQPPPGGAGGRPRDPACNASSRHGSTATSVARRACALPLAPSWSALAPLRSLGVPSQRRRPGGRCCSWRRQRRNSCSPPGSWLSPVPHLPKPEPALLALVWRVLDEMAGSLPAEKLRSSAEVRVAGRPRPSRRRQDPGTWPLGPGWRSQWHGDLELTCADPSRLGCLTRYCLGQGIPARRRRSRASVSESEVTGRPTAY